MIKRIWTGHRSLVIGVAAVAVVAILASSLILVAATGGVSQASPTPDATPTDSPIPTPTDSPTPTPFVPPTPTINTGPTPLPAGYSYSDLDGVVTASSAAHRLPIAIMIDDQKAARPQSGFSTASIVYMAPADGDIDRYMMVFQEGSGTDIGPIRSARPYYVLWADEYKALYGHYGGDTKSLKTVIPANMGNIYNMDAIHTTGCPYHRISTRSAPHNAYTSVGMMLLCAAKRGYPATYQNLPTRPFRGDTDPTLRPNAQSISIVYPTVTVGYQFNPTTDSYLRLLGGVPEIDPANNHQVFARSIVVLYQPFTSDLSGEGGKHAYRPDVHNLGSGKAIIFQEGKQIAATWKKKNNTALTRFYDASGKEIPLVRGEIFMQVIAPNLPNKYKVTVK